MLPIPELSKKSFQELFEESKNKIPALTKEWTDFNYHDPGITMLQLFAWLFEMQNFYAEAIGDVHEYKYLNLLGYRPKKEQPAKGMITLKQAEKTFKMPKGIKFLAGDIVYETEKTETVLKNTIKRVLRDETLIDITDKLTSLDGGYETIFTKEGKSCFYIGFTEPLNLKETLALYFKIYEGTIKRSDFNENDILMGECQWEAYTLEGWKTITDVNDKTAALLKDGTIRFTAPFETAPLQLKGQREALHYLRCTLIKNEYDLLPKIDTIAINVFPVIQQDTLVTSLFISGTGETEQTYVLEHCLALEGEIIVTVKTDTGEWESYVTAEETKAYSIEQKDELFKQVVFSLERHGGVPKKGKKNIRILCYQKGIYKKCLLGAFKGYSHQEFELDLKDIYYEKLRLDAIQTKGNLQVYKKYKQVDNLYEFGAKESVYSITEEGKAMFGDKIHGEIPVNQGSEVVITSLATTKGIDGNVKEYKIQSFQIENSQVIKGIIVTNDEATTGGINSQTKEEAILSFRKELTKENRAITPKDYETIVKETPGLLIHKVKAISETLLNTGINCSNKVYIIVKPYSDKERPLLSEVYKKAIAKQIEKYRLLTVETEILSPTYLPIDVYGCLYKKEGCEEAKIYKYIKNAVDSIDGSRDFGEPIIIGSLFGQLDSQEGIAYIDSFALSPIGTGGERNLTGDIITMPNVLTYLRNYHVELR